MSWLSHILKSRKQRLLRAAPQMDMIYYQEVDRATVSELQQFVLFQKGKAKSRRIKHFMHQYDLSRKTDFYLFDFRFSRHDEPKKQTVFWCLSDQLNLPWFYMEPQKITHTLEKFLGKQEITFEAYPSFDRNYWIEGTDESAVRYLFNEAFLDFFNREPGWCMEGFRNQFVFYRYRKRISPEDCPHFLEMGKNVFDLLLKRGTSTL